MLMSTTYEPSKPLTANSSIDLHPDRRAAQIEAARQTLRCACSDIALREACDTLLMVSRDPADLMVARRLRTVEQSP